MKTFKTCGIIIGILMIVSGIYCIANPSITYLVIGYVIAFNMIFDAIGRIYMWWQFKKNDEVDTWLFASGILSAICGTILIVDVAALISVDIFIAYLIATWLLVHSVISIIRAFRIRKFHKDFNTIVIGEYWWFNLLLSCFMCIFAVLSIINPVIIMTSIGIFIGLGVITSGVSMVTLATTAIE